MSSTRVNERKGRGIPRSWGVKGDYGNPSTGKKVVGHLGGGTEFLWGRLALPSLLTDLGKEDSRSFYSSRSPDARPRPVCTRDLKMSTWSESAQMHSRAAWVLVLAVSKSSKQRLSEPALTRHQWFPEVATDAFDRIFLRNYGPWISI